MLLGDLVDNLVVHLNDNKAKWTEEDITVSAELDVMPDEVDTLKVYVMPMMVQPMIEGDKQRGTRHSIKELLIVALLLAQKFSEIPDTSTEGVGNWSTEVKPLVNTWHRTQNVMMMYESPQLTIEGIEPTPPEPIQLDERVYAVMTTFSYEQVVCDTQHDLSSASIASVGGTMLQRIRASIESQPSSG